MPAQTHADMHYDHGHWLIDVSMWRDDIELWKEESRTALANVKQIHAALRRLAQGIHDHDKAVKRHLASIQAHERSISGFEQTGEGDSIQMLTRAKAHKAEVADHAKQRQAHEDLKKECHTLMAHWNVLLRELTKPRA
jgi:hypothetical protein